MNVEGWEAAVLQDDLRSLKMAASEPQLVRLLPYFDSFLPGHKPRKHLVAVRHNKTVYRTEGWIASVVLVGGRIMGVWAHAREGNRLRVRVTKFAALSKRVAVGIREEADRLGHFLGSCDVEAQIV